MKKYILSTLSAVALLCSCGGRCGDVLSGEWRIAEVNGKSVVGEMEPFIGFNPQDSTIYGNSSCNRFFGRILYDESDCGAISFGNVGSTKMLCANSPMEVEIESAINRVATYRYSVDGELELLDGDNSVLLLLTPRSDE